MIGEPKEKYKIDYVWKEKVEYGFNVLLAKQIFREKQCCIITGSDDGIVRVYKPKNEDDIAIGLDTKNGKSYETKGGPIHSLLSHNVTRFGSHDILVSDSKGMFTIMTDGQILNRRSLCTSKISTQLLHLDSANNLSIILGSDLGTLISATPYSILWKCRLPEVLKQDSQKTSITYLHVLNINTASSDVDYLLVADSNKNLHLFLNGKLITTLQVPSVITCMCSGSFIAGTSTEQNSVTPSISPRNYTGNQVAISTSSGAIFILSSNLNIIPYYNVSFPLTNIQAMQASGADDVDAIICTGHFNSLCILQDGKCVSTYNTSDWVHSFSAVECQNENNMLVLGSLDQTIQLVKITKNR